MRRTIMYGIQEIYIVFFAVIRYNNMKERRYYLKMDKKTLRTLFLGAIGCILVYWLLHETGKLLAILGTVLDILTPFIAGAAIAFILNVPMRAIEKGLRRVKRPGLRRVLAVLLTFAAVILVLIGVFWLLIPQIGETVTSLVGNLPDFFNRIQASTTEYLNSHPEVMEWLKEAGFESIDWSGLAQRVLTFLSNGASTAMEMLINLVVKLSNGIFDAVLSFVFGIYCLTRKEILARQLRRLLYSFVPEKAADEVVRILRMSNATFSRFISGQCLEAVILGSMFAVVMSVFGFPYVPLVSVTISVTALIPIVGAFIGCVVGAFFILVESPVLAFWFVIMFLVLQQVEGNLIYPRVVGTSIGLPGMWVLVAVAVGGDLMGIGGMLVMIPLASVLYALMREITAKRLAARGIDREKLQDHPPELKTGRREKAAKIYEKKTLKRLFRKKNKGEKQ